MPLPGRSRDLKEAVPTDPAGRNFLSYMLLAPAPKR
jgi:hypothetical protein